ncbi:MAG: DUF4430 domain-containing protein [Thermoplasmata archaeon]|nr:DUF4430 domain-containing protein [Thermoplasmata archaeon]
MKLREIRERNKAILFGIVMIAGMLGLAFLGSFITGVPIKRSQIDDIQIVLVGDDWTIECTMDSTVNNTVYLLLKECGDVKDFEVKGTTWEPYDAVFVDTINDLGNSKGKYWQYYVNGEYGEVSSDRKRIDSGDLVEWKWEVPQI